MWLSSKCFAALILVAGESSVATAEVLPLHQRQRTAPLPHLVIALGIASPRRLARSGCLGINPTL
jgi:hypothetical protein